jgi:hypothetical protein
VIGRWQLPNLWGIAKRAMHQVHPTVGQWYLRPESGHKFEVIDIDGGMIETQDEEGTLDQLESDAWFTETLEATDQPQNATGSFDNISATDEADDDAVDLQVLHTEPLRVAHEEMLNDSGTGAEEGDKSKLQEGNDLKEGDGQ